MQTSIGFLDSFLDWLRGDAKSLRSRFYRRPREWVSLKLAYMRGISYTEWYARRMDNQARRSTAKQRPVSEWYLADAGRQLDYLKQKGLQPHHRLLEYGCGIMRAGMLFIQYLEPSHYTGTDISRQRVEKGMRLADEKGIDRSRYSTAILSSAEAKELDAARFDYVLAYDVLCHMPIDECERCLKHLREHIEPQGKLFFTYSRAEQPYATNAKDYWFTREQVNRAAENAGWRIEEQPDWEPYRLDVQPEQTMVLLTPKSAG